MRYFSRGHRALALMVAITIGTAGLPAFASQAPARIAGRILQTGTSSGVKNAVVKVALRPDAKVYESTRTDAKGSYSVAGLPSGTYDVAVESSGGLYVSTAPVSLVAGEKRDLSLTIRPDARSGDTSADDPAAGETPPAPAPAEPAAPPPDKPKEDAAKPADADKQSTKKKKSFWRTPWGGAIIVVGTALVVGAAAHSSDSSEPATASPSED